MQQFSWTRVSDFCRFPVSFLLSFYVLTFFFLPSLQLHSHSDGNGHLFKVGICVVSYLIPKHSFYFIDCKPLTPWQHTPRSATTKGFNSAHKAVNIQLYHSVSDVLYNSSFLDIRDAFHMLVCMDPLLHDTRYVVPEAQPQTIGYSSAFTSCTVLVTSTITFFLTRSSIMSSMAANVTDRGPEIYQLA